MFVGSFSFVDTAKLDTKYSTVAFQFKQAIIINQSDYDSFNEDFFVWNELPYSLNIEFCLSWC